LASTARKATKWENNIDAQDAQDYQDESFLHQKPARAVIRSEFTDAQDCKPAVS